MYYPGIIHCIFQDLRTSCAQELDPVLVPMLQRVPSELQAAQPPMPQPLTAAVAACDVTACFKPFGHLSAGFFFSESKQTRK